MEFNVIIYDINARVFEPYDVIKPLVRWYNDRKEKPNPYFPVPKTFEEFLAFVKQEAQYHWWAKCEYEIILSDWPSNGVEEKWDIYKQVMMNHEVITRILIKELAL